MSEYKIYLTASPLTQPDIMFRLGRTKNLKSLLKDVHEVAWNEEMYFKIFVFLGSEKFKNGCQNYTFDVCR